MSEEVKAPLSAAQLSAVEVQALEMIKAHAKGEALRSWLLANGNPLSLPTRGATIQPWYDMLVTVEITRLEMGGKAK